MKMSIPNKFVYGDAVEVRCDNEDCRARFYVTDVEDEMYCEECKIENDIAREELQKAIDEAKESQTLRD